MAGKKKDRIESRDITGLKYFDKLAPLLERLHEDGCERDRAGNRQLHYDQYCLLILLYLFNPVVTSLPRCKNDSCRKGGPERSAELSYRRALKEFARVESLPCRGQ